MSVDTLDPTLVQGLRRLKLRRVRQLAPEVCQTARTQRWRPEELLRVLIEEECKARDESNRLLRLKQAAFPVHKTLAGFDVAASSVSQATFDYLASLEWLPEHRNLALVGPPGTGKSGGGRLRDPQPHPDLELALRAVDQLPARRGHGHRHLGPPPPPLSGGGPQRRLLPPT